MPFSEADRRSGRVFFGLLPLLLLALAFPELPNSWLAGMLLGGAGGLMLVFPPEKRVPRLWLVLAAGFVLAAGAGFLSRDLAPPQSWRANLEGMGLETGSRLYIHPWVSLEQWSGWLVTVLIGIYLMGHRVESRMRLRLVSGWAIGVALLVAVAILTFDKGEVFGYFPNRNHFATLLAMGSVVAAGALVQAIRYRKPWLIGLMVIAVALLAVALVAFSESRAGVLLAAVGLAALFGVMGSSGYLKGDTAKAVGLLVLGVLGFFLLQESAVKSRLSETLEAVPGIIDEPGPMGVDAPAASADLRSIDGRISIYQDTFSMIRAELWSGVGPGQFRYVFPYYRERTTASHELTCLHPESDWLMVAAETGVISAICLALLVVCVGGFALRRGRSGGARAVTVAGVVAALLVPLHGVFDVPGHREGLAWSALWLVALCLPGGGGRRSDDGSSERVGRGSRTAWRVTGALLAVGGLALMATAFSGRPLPPSEQVVRHGQQMLRHHRADMEAYAAAAAEGRDYLPGPGEDPLEEAMEEAEAVLAILPLEAQYHNAMGLLGLCYDDKEASVGRHFAIERALLPQRVSVPLNQANALLPVYPQRVMPLFREVMQRAESERAPNAKGPDWPASSYQKLLRINPKSDDLWRGCLELAQGDAGRLLDWSRAAPPALLDELLPDRIPKVSDPEKRRDLLKVWRGRGSAEVAEEFERAHRSLFPKGE